MIMERLLSVAIAVGLSLILVSCADEVPTTALEEATSSTPGTQVPALTESYSTHAVLSAMAPDPATAKGPPSGNNDGFATPLFGLSTAPNGDILVADAGAGIATADGATEIELPGVSDMDPLGRSSMWAINPDPAGRGNIDLHKTGWEP